MIVFNFESHAFNHTFIPHMHYKELVTDYSVER